jgi:hypothetical protein
MYNGIHFREDPSSWLWTVIIVWGIQVIRKLRGLLSSPCLNESEPGFGCLCADAVHQRLDSHTGRQITHSFKSHTTPDH